MAGNGNGTFAAPVDTRSRWGRGKSSIGDFNRDGVTDIATGNQSSIVRDDCAPIRKTWDSVSILRGQGNGTFTGPWDFSIGDQGSDPGDAEDDRYRNTLTSLNTSDLNGDDRPISSPPTAQCSSTSRQRRTGRRSWTRDPIPSSTLVKRSSGRWRRTRTTTC